MLYRIVYWKDYGTHWNKLKDKKVFLLRQRGLRPQENKFLFENEDLR